MSTFTRPVAVALVGLAIGLLPDSVSGTSRDSEEIPIVVESHVRAFVNEDVIKSLRAKLQSLIGGDEIAKASVKVTYSGGGMRIAAVTTLPILRGEFSHAVKRQLSLTTTGWSAMPSGLPVKSSSGDYEWEVMRTIAVVRIFNIDGVVVEMACSDGMSFNETRDALTLVKHEGLVPSPDLKNRESFKSPWVWEVSGVVRTGHASYRVFGKRGESGWCSVYRCKIEGGKLIALSVSCCGP